MAVLAILLPDDPAPLDGQIVKGLVELGVTRFELLGDADSVAVVLEGWAFTPRTAAPAVLALLGDPPGARILHTIVRVAVDAATQSPER